MHTGRAIVALMYFDIDFDSNKGFITHIWC